MELLGGLEEATRRVIDVVKEDMALIGATEEYEERGRWSLLIRCGDSLRQEEKMATWCARPVTSILAPYFCILDLLWAKSHFSVLIGWQEDRTLMVKPLVPEQMLTSLSLNICLFSDSIAVSHIVNNTHLNLFQMRNKQENCLLETSYTSMNSSW